MNGICEGYQNKTALIIGKDLVGMEIAKAFMQLGCNLAFGDIDSGWEDEIRDYAESLGRTCCLRRVSTDKEDIRSFIDEAAAYYGSIDILVNSYRINILKKAEKYDSESWDKVWNMNIDTLYFVTQCVAEIMKKQHSGKILNLSSVLSYLGMPKDYVVYCATEGAINGLTKQTAKDLERYNIQCNAIASTFTRSPINSFQLDDPVFYNALINRIPKRRICLPKDIASAAVFLCSESAGRITGQIIGVDGGLTAVQ